MGHLKLHLEPDGDGTGELFASFESNGFSGNGSAWFDLTTLAEIAKQFEQYPLPSTPPVRISGGYWQNNNPPVLKNELLHVSAYPINSRGGIGVHVRVAHEFVTTENRLSMHSAAGELKASYEQMKAFSKSLIALTREEVAEVVLDEKDA